MTEKEILKEEKEKELAELTERLSALPKGHVNTLYRNGKGYFYRTFRDGKKVRNEYLGPAGSTDLNPLFSQMKERDMLKEKIRSLKEDLKQLKKKAREDGSVS